MAWKIKEDYQLPYIFLTSNADPSTVERAKKVTPPAYLVKPFNKDDLYTSIEMALYNYSNNLELSDSAKVLDRDVIIKDAFFIKDKNLFHKVKFTDITYVKAEHVYVEIYTNSNKMFLSRCSLTKFSQKLPGNFFRTHRSYIVNLDYLDAINYLIVIVNGIEVPIGKNYRDELLKRVNVE